MSKNIVVPELGESVVEATVIRWIKNEGEAVSMGETLVELETEKANFEVAAETAGVLEKILKNPDEDVNIGDVLGMINENGTVTADIITEVKPAEETHEEPKNKESTELSDVKITPVASRLIDDNKLDAANIRGTGPNNKITKEDVENYLKTNSQGLQEEVSEQQPSVVDTAPKPPATSVVIPEADDREHRVRMSARRRTIARRLLEAQSSAAILTTFNEVDMGPVMEVRKRRK